MVTIALLDPRLEAQLGENHAASAGLEIVARATVCDSLLELASARKAQVLIVNMDLLGDDPVDTLGKLARAFEPELALIVYYFAKRDVIKALTGPQRRTLRGPLALDALRAQLTSLLVRDKLTRATDDR